MTAAQPSMTSNSKVELGWGVKLVIGLSTLLSTLVATGVGALINHHFVEQQATTAMRQGDVRKLEDQVQAFDTAMRVYVAGINKGEATDSTREAVASNIEQQYAFLQTLLPLAQNEPQRQQIAEYRRSLLDVNRKLRASRDVFTTMPLAGSVAHTIDARIAAINSLRRAVGLPADKAEADALEPAEGFGQNEQVR